MPLAALSRLAVLRVLSAAGRLARDRYAGTSLMLSDALRFLLTLASLATLFISLSGCSTLSAIQNAEQGAGVEAARVWQRWVDSGGDIAVATTWERKVKSGVTIMEIEQAFTSVAAEDNIKAVGEFPLSKELEARTGRPGRFLKVYSYCSPMIARQMVDFSPHMAAYLPCRIAVVEQEDGFWLYALNMDMLINMGRKLPPELRASVLRMRETIWKMLERGAQGDF